MPDIFNLSFPGLISAFSRRASGNTSLSYGDTIASLINRKNFLLGLGIDYKDLVCAKQVHGSAVRYVKEEDKGKGALSYDTAIADTDAFVTDKKNLPIAIFTADCLSVFLYDPKRAVIGLVHAGWRSSRENIVVKTIKLMQDEFGTLAKDISAGLGPAIRECCYEVGSDFCRDFPTEALERGNRYYLDLAGVNKRQLREAGVDAVFDPCICTYCRNKDFFSFRKEGASSGRMLSVAMLK